MIPPEITNQQLASPFHKTKTLCNYIHTPMLLKKLKNKGIAVFI
jgi:hypothetical protein